MKSDFEDLSALARRKQLSELEARKLDNLLEASSEARFWHQAGCAFDAEGVDEVTDRDASERVVARLTQATPRKRSPFERYRFLLIAAALSLIVSASAAAVIVVRRSHETESATLATPPTNSERSAHSQKPIGNGRPPEPTPQAPVPRTPEPGSSAPSAPTTPNHARPEPMQAASAAELLSAAGNARRRGDTKQATQLLESLQTRFPNSAEAKASDIALGKLKLQSGAARSALTYFERYLKRSPSGTLAPEAMWGRAQALSAVGNQAEAQRSLSELVKRYPNSPYASSAKAKLRVSPPQ
jgi:TolA-binding protein